MERLQFVHPDLASFANLDSIAELQIPLPHEPTGENVPLWYRRKESESDQVCHWKPIDIYLKVSLSPSIFLSIQIYIITERAERGGGGVPLWYRRKESESNLHE